MNFRSSFGLVVCLLVLSGCDYFRSVASRIERAEQLTADFQYRAAAIELKNALEKEPNNAKARLLLADIWISLVDPIGAQRELEAARANGADAAAANEIEIRMLLATGRYDDALAKLGDAKFLLAEPKRSLQLARVYLGLQRYAEALALFDAALVTNPQLQDAQLGRAEARVGLGQIEAVLSDLSVLLQRDPKAAQAWALQGILQTRIGQTDQAVTSLETAHREAERHLTLRQHADVLSLLIELQLGRRNLVGAEQALQALNKVLPGTLIARLLKSRIAIAKEDYTGAAQELERIVQAAPEIAPAQFLLGMVLLRQGNLNQAERYLARAVQLAPQHLEARKLLAQAQLRLDRPQAAIQSLMPALDDPGVDMQVHGLLGLAEKQAGLETNSIDYLLRAVSEQPDDDSRKLDLAAAYLRTANYDDAITTLRTVDDSKLAPQRAAMLALALARTKGVESARAELEAQLERNPKSVDMMGVAADFYAQTGQVQRGIDLLGKAIRAAPRDVFLFVSRARLLAMHGDVVGAERDLQSALAIQTDNRIVLLALADLSYRRGQVAASVEWLNRLSKTDPDDVQVELLKARALLSAKQPAMTQQASALLDRLVQAHPDRSDIRSAVARLYVGAGRYEEALVQLRAGAGVSAQDASIQLEIARTQVALSQFEDARRTLAELLLQKPNWLPAAALASWLDIERHENDAAVARMAALRKLQPNDPNVLAAEGEILMAAGKPAAAAEAFAAALRLQPTAAIAMKAYLARVAARLPEPTLPLQNYVDTHRYDTAARGALAQAYQQSGESQRAIVEYEKMLAETTASPLLLNNLAWLYSEAGDKRALATARQAVALAPNNPAVADTLGWILLGQGLIDEALPVLKSAAAGAPKDGEIRYHYALALAKSGARDEATRNVAEALRQAEPFPSRSAAERLQRELSNGTAANRPIG